MKPLSAPPHLDRRLEGRHDLVLLSPPRPAAMRVQHRSLGRSRRGGLRVLRRRGWWWGGSQGLDLTTAACEVSSLPLTCSLLRSSVISARSRFTSIFEACGGQVQAGGGWWCVCVCVCVCVCGGGRSSSREARLFSHPGLDLTASSPGAASPGPRRPAQREDHDGAASRT
jgi:hypothetical protein